MSDAQTVRVLDDFIGTWRIVRQIRHAQGPEAQFAGSAIWSWSDEGALYTEEGRLMLPGHPEMKTERRYIWRRPLDVFFEDGRFFHSVPELGGESHHFCDPDDYRATYRFDDWPSFETTWQVKGPRKDYVMASHYTRL